jgi:hypothetical protein|tara:strand:+ start:12085 stop:13053 length:969 start_codon:yes stop_codon:yes gene_type:complete
MDIHVLKRSLFNDLKDPMHFLSDYGLHTTGLPDAARAFGNSVYFYSNNREWSVLTPASKVLHSTVNSFKTETHTLAIDPPPAWKKQMKKQLKDATELVYEQQLLTSCSHFSDFASFWEHCRIPPFLTIEAPAFSRRGHHKQFINMFIDGQDEVTGLVTLNTNGTVNVAIRWSLSESEDSGQVGWRPHFAGGIQVQKFGGLPFAIRKPWSWENLNGLSVPMHDSFVVKTPGLSVGAVDGSVVHINTHKKPVFEAAIQALHRINGAQPWDGRLCIVGNKKAMPGSTIVASIMPQQTNGTITWYTQKLSVCNPTQPVAKRQKSHH